MSSFPKIAAFLLALIGSAHGQSLTHAPGGATPVPPVSGNQIQHVIFIFQENRSFDEYFGAYSDPADNGIQTQAGTSTNGNTTLVVTDSSKTPAGWYVGGPGINAAGITVSTITDATHVVLSSAPGSGSGAGTFMFQPVNGLTQAFSKSPCVAGAMLSAGIPNATTNIGVPINGTSTPCYNVFANHADVQALGDHDAVAAQADIDDGVTTALADGYVNQQVMGNTNYCGQPQIAADGVICLIQTGGNAAAVSGVRDSMQYMLREDLPNYWAYADQFTILDNFFPGQRDWSLPAHLDIIAEWPAAGALTTIGGTSSIFYDSGCRYSIVSNCRTVTGKSNGSGQWPTTPPAGAAVPYANLFQLFDQNADKFGHSAVSYKWYLGFIQGSSTSACVDGSSQTCIPQLTAAEGSTSSPPPHWNVRSNCDSTHCPPSGLNGVNIFNWVQQQITASSSYTTAHFPNKGINQFYLDVASGTCALPDVSWVIPAYVYSEHPPARAMTGMQYVTALVNALEQSPCLDGTVPYWKNTVIFISWDDWGGAYDHAIPPNVYNCLNNSGVKDGQCGGTVAGWGIRVPAIMISPYVTANTVYHGAVSFDAIPTFIEDNIFNTPQRLDPTASNLLNVSAGGTGGTFAPTSVDHRPFVFDGLKGTTINYCCSLGSTTVGDLNSAGNIATNLTNGTIQARPTPLTTHIPTGVYVNCGASGAQYATNTTYICTAAVNPAVHWDSIKQGTFCSGSPCVPNPVVAITYKVYRSTDGGAWSCIAGAVGCTSTSAITDPTITYTDTGTASGHIYDWRVSATLAGQSETPMGPAVRGITP